MKPMLPVALAICAICSAPALAGRNRDGAMLVHTDDNAIYYTSTDYCANALPVTCEELVTTTHKAPETDEAIIWFLAVFDPTTSPEVMAVQFGIETNLPTGQGLVVASGACGPDVSLELPEDGFPDVGRGNLVGYTDARTDHIWPFYWFAVLGKDGQSNEFGTAVYPGDGRAVFVDNGSPPREDLITDFGVVRWGVAGSNSCPVFIPLPTGACCTRWGGCVQEVDQETCEDAYGVYEGTYAGDSTVCAPIVCAACCYSLAIDENERRCVHATESACNTRFSIEGSDGQYTNPSWSGPGNRCTSSPDSVGVRWYCGSVPTRSNSWGAIKSLFR